MRVAIATVTNTVNDNKTITSKLIEDELQEMDFRSEKQQEVDNWNYHTPGAMSYRYIDIVSYDVKTCTLEDLLTLPLTDVIKIIDFVRKSK